MCSAFFRTSLSVLVVGVSLLAVTGCRSAPITGRRQFVVLPESQEVSLGLSAYSDVLSKQPASTDQHYIELVNRVGKRIAAVSDRPDFDWEFRVLATQEKNAFCLPGGKVAVHEGIIPVCESEAGLAVVMSHEVAHALARHGGERMSQGYAVEATRQAVSYVTGQYMQQKQEMILRAYGAASQYGVILPYSRKHESEADYIGLMLMARAGYDPHEAPRFWQRFSTMKEGTPAWEFLSTHPSDDRRASDLLAALPEAEKEYESSAIKLGRGEPIPLAGAPAITAEAPPAAGSALVAPALMR